MKNVNYIFNCCFITWFSLITCEAKSYDEVYQLKNYNTNNYPTDYNLVPKNDGKHTTGNTPIVSGSTYHPGNLLQKQTINQVGDLQTHPYNAIEQKPNNLNKSDTFNSMKNTFHTNPPPIYANIHQIPNEISKKQLYNPSDQSTSLENTQIAEERSSYVSYVPENSIPIQPVQVPETKYHTQPLYPQHNYGQNHNHDYQQNHNHNYQQNHNPANGYGAASNDVVLQEKQEEDTFEDYEKDKYFYHKSKIATKAAYWVIAVHFLVIAANFAYASFLATFTGSTDPPRGERRKREAKNEVSGGATFEEALSCMTKFMCEYDQSQNIHDVRTGVPKPIIKERQDHVVDRRSDAKKRRKWRQLKQRDFRRRRRRRPRREVSRERNCAQIYNACPIDFSLFFKLKKFLG